MSSPGNPQQSSLTLGNLGTITGQLQDVEISPRAPGGPYSSIEQELGDFFCLRDGMPRTSYTDTDLQQISSLLQIADRRSWSRVPRTYTVLRMIGQLYLLDSLIDQGITDIGFPFTAASLPAALSPAARGEFLDCQSAVLTKSLDFEKGERRRHFHFGRGEPIPYEVRAKLGSGGYGEVEKVVSLISHCEFARKKFRRGRSSEKSQKEIKSFLSELQILRRIKHIHCVEMIGSYTDPTYFALIMSPVANCNMATYMSHSANSTDEKSVLRTFFGCLANGLQYLHDAKIRHRDIKPENILVKGEMVYLTDFGISLDWEDLSGSTTTADSAKSILYCAPEVANYQPRNSSSDVWSLGCVFLEMVTALKGEKITNMRSYFKDRSGDYRFYRNRENAMQWIEQLHLLGSKADNAPLSWITEMLELNPTSRPTAPALFAQISGRRAGDMTVPISFCGLCCGGEGESPVASESDGEVWAEDQANVDPGVSNTSIPAIAQGPAQFNDRQGQHKEAGQPSGRVVQMQVEERTRLEAKSNSGRYTKFRLPHPSYPHLAHNSEKVYTIQLSGNYLVSGGQDKTVRIWNLSTGTLVQDPLEGHTGSVTCLQFDESEQEDIVISGGVDTSFIIWKFSTGKMIERIGSAHEEAVLDIRFNEAFLVTCSKDKLIRIWSRKKILSGDPYYRVEADRNTQGQSVSPYSLVRTLVGHRAAVNAVEIAGDEIASASGDRTVKIWNIITGECLMTLQGHTKGIACIHFDGQKIVSGSSDKTIRIFSRETGRELSCIVGHSDLVRAVKAEIGGSDSHSRRIVSGSYDGTVIVWKQDEGLWIPQQKLEAPPPIGYMGGKRVFDVRFDAKMIISCSESGITGWDFAEDRN
ncbi:MAG: hypothetical protein M1839_005028 [Geoglossum umbratile]|nr:MAG: hypothetical protein M1839_005028 [Geoglossum umbratile]